MKLIFRIFLLAFCSFGTLYASVFSEESLELSNESGSNLSLQSDESEANESDLSLSDEADSTVHKEVDKSKRPKEKKCPYCAKLFRRQKNFQEHIIVKHEKSATHKCDQCSQSFGYLSKLHDHQKQVHQRVKCEDCGKDVCNAFMLKRHRATVHGIKPIDSHQCNQCPMFFTIRSSLDKHIAAKHPSL